MNFRLLAGRAVSRTSLATPCSRQPRFLYPLHHHLATPTFGVVPRTHARHFFFGRSLRNTTPRQDEKPPQQQHVPVPEESEHRVSPQPQSPVNAGPAGYAGGNPFSTGSGILDAALTTVIGLSMGASLSYLSIEIRNVEYPNLPVFFGGVAYVAWYKKNVLDKV